MVERDTTIAGLANATVVDRDHAVGLFVVADGHCALATDGTSRIFPLTIVRPVLCFCGAQTAQPVMHVPHRRFFLLVLVVVTMAGAALAASMAAAEGDATPRRPLAWPLPPLPWRGRPHPPPVLRLPAAAAHAPPPPAGTNAPVAACMAAEAAADRPECAYAAAGDDAYEAVGDREQALAERLAAAGVDGRIWIE